MSKIKIGDIVARKSYGKDIFFKITDIISDGYESVFTLKGISYRIEADAPESDLEVQSENSINEYRNRSFIEAKRMTREIFTSRQREYSKKAVYRRTSNDSRREFSKPGKALHIDGDKDYLDTCLSEYEKLKVEVIGRYVPEKEQPAFVYNLLVEYKPDILVLTGHDGVIKSNGENDYLSINNYRNSKYFVSSVKEARKYNSDLDGLVIFAGACQSMFDEIIKAGANFASAPYRVLIHALDPVYVCQKIAFTSVGRLAAPIDVINATITGSKGIGGLQTKGKYRDGYPQWTYSE